MATKLEARVDLPALYVNDGKLEPSQIGRLVPMIAGTASMEEMRHRFSDSGYLLVKGLLPREDVLEARRKYFDMLSCTGILRPGTAHVDGLFDSSKDPADYPGFGTGRPGSGTAVSDQFMDIALKAHAESWYARDICKHPALIDFVGDFTGWGEHTGSLERTLLRNNVPGNKAIGVHYDYIFLRHGEDSVLTAWVPLGDIKVDGGGLIYLEDGHVIGRDTERNFTAKAIASGLTEEEAKFAFNKNMAAGGVLTQDPKAYSDSCQRRWLVSNYEAGDVVFHNSYMIHASTMNYDQDGVIRLGTDLRFVDVRKPWDMRWAKVYEDGDGL
ncbi:hypothetical protein J7T55_000257 [Diaporthe amygdali]|uniref:uncharacterized protein n=1 Tax=Phomopsis amygdali TaxID=1214568 RepID=UPI0022FDD402|nr:uncharacterized protein J7T55_000257 [Diaporthe amygdali]KAJ0109332.1 hypothetical protein J7T55_000257 [Diaporthe amygdali]